MVFVNDSKATPGITSLVIAEGVGYSHASVIKLIRKHRADLELFGRVRFEISPFDTAGGEQQREYAILNEQQASLLMQINRAHLVENRDYVTYAQKGVGGKALCTAWLNSQKSGSFQPFEVVKGRTGGTYAVEEIALDYAAWIGPELALRIQRGFIALRRGDIQGAAEQAFPNADIKIEYKTPKNLQEAMRMAADALDREDEAKRQSAIAEALVHPKLAVRFYGRPCPDCRVTPKDKTRRL